MARCGSCGEPSVLVLAGTAAEIEASPLIEIRCHACAMGEAADQILAEDAKGAPGA